VVFCCAIPCDRAGCYPDFGGTFYLNGCFRGVKRPGHEFDHSPPFSAAMKNEWNYTSAPPIFLRAVDLGNFTYAFSLYNNNNNNNNNNNYYYYYYYYYY
jgi:hypothetical protein